MAFTPNEFYTFALSLQRSLHGDCAALRSSISRAYYGAFITARDHYGVTSRGRDGHEQVLKAMRGNAHGDLAADNLQRLKDLREKADYQPQIDMTVNDTHKAISHSKKVLHSLGKLPVKPVAIVAPPSLPAPK